MAIFGRKRVVVIGGNAAGMTAASRLRRLDPEAEITIIEQSGHISYSICGTPYYLEGLIPDADKLVIFSPERLWDERRIRARTEWSATDLLTGRRSVECRDRRTGRTEQLPFDNLVLATGYRPVTSGIAGAGHPAVFKISQLEDPVRLNRFVEQHRPRTTVIVGAGYVGLNMAEALSKRGLSVRILQKGDQVFRAADPEISALVEQECRSAGIDISLFTPVSEIVLEGDRPTAAVSAGKAHAADLLIVDIGVEPNVDLARQAGITLGVTGSIEVSARMVTSQDDVYAAGNCAETLHRITRRPVASALGTHAVKQGRVAGENIAGRRSEFSGVLQTSVTRFFSLSVARTGLTQAEAARFGFDFGAVLISSPARAGYFPPKETVTVKLIFERGTAKILGVQIAGPPWSAKRIDVAVTAITAGLTLEQVAQLDLAYSPPHAPLWDPLLVAANAALRQLHG